MNIVITILLILFLHALYNLINFLRYPIIEKNLMLAYSTDANSKMKALSHRTQILNYIKYAGVKDKHLPVTQAVGYGQIASANASIFDNILNNRQDIAGMAIECLLEAKGNYWSKFINSFNPFYWIRFILFIPKNILSYLGLNDKSIIIKIFQLIYWIFAAICTFLLAIFPNEIKTFVLSLFHFT